MASTDKTKTLGLNQWAGTDDVVRVDFNADNEKIDGGIAALGARITGEIATVDSKAAAAAAAAATADSKAVNAQSAANTAQNAANTAQNKANAAQTAADSARPVIGKFTGDGVFPRKINLGFAPSALISFTNDENNNGILYISTKYSTGLICYPTSIVIRSGTMLPELSSTGFSISDKYVGNLLQKEFFYIAFR